MAMIDNRAAGRPVQTERQRRDMAEAARKREARAVKLEALRKRQAWTDAAGGALIFALTFWLWYGIPGSVVAWVYLMLTIGVGAGAGWCTSRQRGHYAIGIFGAAVVVDAVVLQLLVGDMGTGMLTVVLRGFVVMLLGGMVGFSRKMGAYEGI